VIAAPRAVGVELAHRDLPLGEIFAGRRVGFERSGGRDVIGRHHIAQKRQNPRALDIGDGARLGGHVLEIGRVLDIGRFRRPVIGFALGGLHRLPFLVALEHVGIFRLERLAGHRALHQFGDFRLGRPDVLEVDVVAVLVLAQRVSGNVHVHVADQRIGHHQRRRGEVVGAHIGADPALEVAVARQHRGGDQVVIVDRLADRCRQRAGVADASGAAIAHEVEADGIQILLQFCCLQVVRDDLAARRQRGFHPGLAGQALFARLAGHQAGTDHHIGVRRVGAGGDRRDHDGPVMQLVRAVLGLVPALAVMALVAGDVGGFRRAAFPFPPRLGAGRGVLARPHALDVLAEGRGRLVERDVVLRALGARDGGHDGAHVQAQRVGIDRRIIRAAP